MLENDEKIKAAGVEWEDPGACVEDGILSGAGGKELGEMVPCEWTDRSGGPEGFLGLPQVPAVERDTT